MSDVVLVEDDEDLQTLTTMVLENIAAAYASGAQEYVGKPYTVEELLSAVDRQVPEQFSPGNKLVA